MPLAADGADPRARERVGSVLNEKWTLEKLLGSGGMGAVYAAKHRNGARAAVKVLHPELARMPEVRERFLREGYAANRVEHKGAVQVLDDDIVKSGPDEGSAYLVMELLEGESLQERVVRGPKLTERDLLEVMDAVLDVLAAAHDHGVVHRDLKPENIFLAQDEEREGIRVKVLDFGLARLTETSSTTNAGIAVGTPSFMSPEQAAGRSAEIDGRTDIFALGATMFRIVTGRRIHDADNMVQLVVLMAQVPAPRLRTIESSVSETFASVIDRALAFERDDRYPDAVAMRNDVRAALDTTTTRATAPSFVVIPFSARNVRVGSAADIPPAAPAEEEAPAANADSAKDDDDDDDDAKVQRGARRSRAYVETEEESAIRAPVKSLARSATLPWVIVLFLLGFSGWKLIPSIQEELVKRTSAWTSAVPAPTASATTTSAEDSVDAAVTATDAEADAAALEADELTDEDASVTDTDVDASSVVAPNVEEHHDASATPRPPSTAAAVRPHPTGGAAPHKPPVKKPPPPPPPPTTWKKPRPRH